MVNCPSTTSNGGFSRLFCSYPAEKQESFHRHHSVPSSSNVPFLDCTEAICNPPQLKFIFFFYNPGAYIKAAIPLTSLLIPFLGVNSE